MGYPSIIVIIIVAAAAVFLEHAQRTIYAHTSDRQYVILLAKSYNHIITNVKICIIKSQASSVDRTNRPIKNKAEKNVRK